MPFFTSTRKAFYSIGYCYVQIYSEVKNKGGDIVKKKDVQILVLWKTLTEQEKKEVLKTIKKKANHKRGER